MTKQATLESDMTVKKHLSAGNIDRVGQTVFTRTFNVPRELVFKALTEPEHIRQWWMPGGYPIIDCQAELVAGGAFCYTIQKAEEKETRHQLVYREIVTNEKLVFISSPTENGTVNSGRWGCNYPPQQLHTILLTEQNGSTLLTVETSLVNDANLLFDDFFLSLDRLEEYLASFFLITIKFFNNGKEYSSYCRQRAGIDNPASFLQ